MLISDSMPLLWLSYVALSLVVLVTGYLAIRWLPRLPRFVITGLVAGMLWVPASFTLPVLDDAPYTGMAPAIVVVGIAVLQGGAGGTGLALSLLLLGMGLGGVAGLLLWAGVRRRDRQGDDAENSGGAKAPAADQRREPVIG